MGEYMSVKLTVVGSSPAWPNPGGAQSGYLLEQGSRRLLLDCGPGVLARLREREQGEEHAWPQVEALAITHFHLDHWGDLVSWVWGRMFGPAQELEPPALWLPPGGRRTLAELGAQLGSADMFEEVFSVNEYAADEAFEAAGFHVVARRVLHYELEAYGFRVSANGVTVAYSGDSGPSEALVELARDADLFLCEATLDGATPEPGTRGHLSADEANAAFEASGAKRLLITHRPFERKLDERYEAVHDGFELELS
jgi:ribonuclease BN (tRNA processing enzyme)